MQYRIFLAIISEICRPHNDRKMDHVEGNRHKEKEISQSDGGLLQNVYPHPLKQFEKWFDDAKEALIPEPNAMVLSTATPQGKPSSRVVLLKEFGPQGFVFFTNYKSRKGQELAQNPQACLNFWWGILERQVRIEGVVHRIPEAESDAYFNSRPAGSRAGAIASPQSGEISSREWLEQRFIEVQLQGDLKRPAHWGGFTLEPSVFEFWVGRSNRLHDRIQYVLHESGNWEIRRLAP